MLAYLALAEPTLDRAMAAYAGRLVCDAVSLSLSAILLARLAGCLRLWSAACQEATGLSWWRAVLGRADGIGDAHPGRMALPLAMGLATGFLALSGELNGEMGEEALRWAASDSALAMGFGTRLIEALIFGFGPLLLVGSALRDESSPVGRALQERAGRPMERQRALLERQALARAAGKAVAAPSKPTRL